MYVSISFGTLSLQKESDANHHTISKTAAQYEKNYFIIEDQQLFPEGNSLKENNRGILEEFKLKNKQRVEFNPSFQWHLN